MISDTVYIADKHVIKECLMGSSTEYTMICLFHFNSFFISLLIIIVWMYDRTMEFFWREWRTVVTFNTRYLILFLCYSDFTTSDVKSTSIIPIRTWYDDDDKQYVAYYNCMYFPCVCCPHCPTCRVSLACAISYFKGRAG